MRKMKKVLSLVLSLVPFCIHGTKSVLSLGTQYHQTQQNITVTHDF